jgi:tetraacyldisaccharide 4'-kinase
MNPFEKPSPWMRPFLDVGESIYGAAIALRRAAYGAGLFEKKRAPRPVISVGNLSVGGTGKTPFVILLANRLAQRNVRVAVLSRGYGRKNEEDLVVVSEGDGPRVSAEHAGDEPVLIAERTAAIVISCADRLRAAELAASAFHADVLLLDDGFQHWRLARDLDLVLLDREDPLANGRLLPRGPLREPADALSRADLLVLVGGEAKERTLLPDRPIVEVGVVPARIELGEEEHPPEWIATKRVALLSGIARPERFRRTVEELGARVVHEDRRPDHAELTELDAFFRAATDAGAELCLTTEKDAARLLHRPENLAVLGIEHRILAGEELFDAALAKVIG